MLYFDCRSDKFYLTLGENTPWLKGTYLCLIWFMPKFSHIVTNIFKGKIIVKIIFQLRDSFRNFVGRNGKGQLGQNGNTLGKNLAKAADQGLCIIDDSGENGQISHEESIEALRIALAEKDNR